MGGIAVDTRHRSNIKNLYAIGECASIYHGANRLGGNSILAAIYSGKVAADDLNGNKTDSPDWSEDISIENEKLIQKRSSESKFPVMYVRGMLADTVNSSLGILRDKASLDNGITDIEYYLKIANKLNYDRSELEYFNYSLEGILTLAKATLIAAQSRCESRGAHQRKDHPESSDDYKAATIISYDGGRFSTKLTGEDDYEG